MKSFHIKKIIFVLFIIVIVFGLYLTVVKGRTQQTTFLQTNHQTQSNSQNINSTNSNTAAKPLPAKFTLTVPFTAQAPTANWDELHNQACEEASSIMANAYFTGINSLPPATVEKQISLLTKWEDANLGYHLSINTQETKKMIEGNYKLSAEISEIDEQKIKRALVDNKLVLLPANGQMLNNPNFKTPGPIYHMIVITGYDGDTFITNDPGTRNGLNYKYTYDVLEAANGNWDKDADQVNLNDKQILIVSKQ